MRVAIVAESFLPNVNGVTNSVLRVLEHLRRENHEALVIAPGARERQEEISHYEGYPIVRVPTVEMPMINSLPIGVPMPVVRKTLQRFQPDVVHLASPFVLGAAGAFAAKSLNIPCVAIFQTDIAGFAKNYKLKALTHATWQWSRAFHNICAMTLAPSSQTIAELDKHGIHNVKHWGRGVDTVRFHPSKRSEKLREEWLREGERKRRAQGYESAVPVMKRRVVGYVGRLAAEKSVERLAALNSRHDIQLVVVGDGPDEAMLRETLPTAVFTGGLYGEDLPQAYASLDIFVHTGQFETFCQAIQEAHASGVPAIAPAAGGPVDLIVPGLNGYLLDADSFSQSLPQAVDSVCATGLASMRAHAVLSVQGKTWESLCGQLLAYYGQAVSGEVTEEAPLVSHCDATRSSTARGSYSRSVGAKESSAA